jgi:hypothetical protein
MCRVFKHDAIGLRRELVDLLSFCRGPWCIRRRPPISACRGSFPDTWPSYLFVSPKSINQNNGPKQLPEQAGFRAKYSTVDHLHTINQIIENTQQYRHKIYVAFIDYRKAFDSLEHTKILDSMEAIDVHQKYIRLIREMYKIVTGMSEQKQESDKATLFLLNFSRA